MLNHANIYRKALPALVIASAAMVMYTQPAAAQTADNVKCTECVNSKNIKDNNVKSADIKDGNVKTDELGNSAVTTTKIADGAVSEDDLSSGVRDKLGQTGDITGVQGGDGLSGGSDSGSVTLDVDFEEVARENHLHEVDQGEPGVGSSGSVTIPYSAFQPRHPIYELLEGTNRDEGYGYVLFGNDKRLCMVAPVQVPDGVTIDQFRMVLRDNTASDDSHYRLLRTDLTLTIDPDEDTDRTDEIADIETDASSAFVRHFDDNTIGVETLIPGSDPEEFELVNLPVNAAEEALTIEGCLIRGQQGETSANLFAAVISYN